MHGRRKRYYHKTIVVRKIPGKCVVGALLFVVMSIKLISGMEIPRIAMNQGIFEVAMDYVFGRTEYSFEIPTAYDRTVYVMPMLYTAEAQKKAEAAKTKGVKKQTAKEEEEKTETKMKVKSTDMSAEGISFRNETGYTPDADACLRQKLSFSSNKKEPKVLIMHTHTSEAYADSEGARTKDSTKNVVRVGEVLAGQLEKNGVSVIHDTTQNDSPSYNGSYTKAMKNISARLEAHPSLEIVLDVHRDYAEQTKNGEMVQLKPVTEIDGEAVAQVMLVVGTDGLGLSHPHWQENLAFAVQLQQELQRIAPSLARPINLRRERFNQHLTKGSLIVEVGTAGNTLAECERAADYIGKALSALLSS